MRGPYCSRHVKTKMAYCGNTLCHICILCENSRPSSVIRCTGYLWHWYVSRHEDILPLVIILRLLFSHLLNPYRLFQLLHSRIWLPALYLLRPNDDFLEHNWRLKCGLEYVWYVKCETAIWSLFHWEVVLFSGSWNISLLWYGTFTCRTCWCACC